MTGNVLEAVHRARKCFEIEGFPGDFFALLEKCNNTEKHKILLFKEDIDKLSGFIGYGKGIFRNKDMGEYELIAIVKCSDDQYEIVSNDKGRVFLHLDQNLFDSYAIDAGLIVISSENWLETIQYRKKE